MKRLGDVLAIRAGHKRIYVFALFFDIAFIIITRTPIFFFISALLQSSLWAVNY